MSEAKRFYWLKLKHEFFSKNIYMKKLRRMENGTELAFLYLELLTYSLADDGILYYQGVEENLAEELALDLDEDPKLMSSLIDFLIKYKLLEEQEDNTFLLVETLESTGSETRQAEYNRKRRAKAKNGNDVPSEDDDVTHDGNNVTQDGNNVTPCYTDDKQCFLEKREKRIELDTEVEVEVRERNKSEYLDAEVEVKEEPQPQPPENVTSFVNYQSIIDEYHSRCPSLPKIKALTSERKQRLINLLAKFSIEQIMLAFDKAEASSRLRGECNGKGYEDFIAGFDWITDEDHFVKILEGKYDSRGQPFYRGYSEADLLENF